MHKLFRDRLSSVHSPTRIAAGLSSALRLLIAIYCRTLAGSSAEILSLKKPAPCARSPARTAGLGGSSFVTPRPRGFRMFLRCRRPFRNSKDPATTLAPGFRPARPHARRRVRASFGRLFALQGPSTVCASSNCQGVPELPMAVYLGLGRQSTGSHCGKAPPRIEHRTRSHEAWGEGIGDDAVGFQLPGLPGRARTTRARAKRECHRPILQAAASRIILSKEVSIVPDTF